MAEPTLEQRECVNCDGRGRVWCPDFEDFDEGGDFDECPDCDGYRVQVRCPECGEWRSPDPADHTYCPSHEGTDPS